jgi:hypothetical protein
MSEPARRAVLGDGGADARDGGGVGRRESMGGGVLAIDAP